MNNIKSHLTPSTFHILLALSQQELHGYEIIKKVKQQSDGRISLLTGTLYNTLKRLLDERMISESRADSRRRYYKATKPGANLVAGEIERYKSVLKLAFNSI